MKFFLPISIAALCVVGCAAAGEDAASAREAPAFEQNMATKSVAGAVANTPAQADAVKVASDQRQPTVIERRQVVRTANLTMRVANVEKAERDASAIIAGSGGYIDNASSSDLSSDHPSMAITMRVPVAAFDGILVRFEKLGDRMSKEISSQDVTEQLVDMDARLKTMGAQEETLRGMLRQTRNLNDMISLQDRLSQLRGEIESIAGQRKSLSGQAALSTITLNLQQAAVGIAPPKDPNWLSQTWAEATGEMGGVMRSLASIVVWLAVFSPFWLTAIWLMRRMIQAARPRSAA